MILSGMGWWWFQVRLFKRWKWYYGVGRYRDRERKFSHSSFQVRASEWDKVFLGWSMSFLILYPPTTVSPSHTTLLACIIYKTTLLDSANFLHLHQPCTGTHVLTPPLAFLLTHSLTHFTSLLFARFSLYLTLLSNQKCMFGRYYMWCDVNEEWI